MNDSLEELESLLPKLPAAVAQQRLGQQLDTSVEKLQSGKKEAERLQALLELADLLGLEGPEQHEEKDEACGEAKFVAKALLAAEDAEQLEQAVDRYEREFLPALKTLHRSLIARWTALRNRGFAPLVQVGQMLAKLDPNSDLGDRLAECGRAATNYNPGASAEQFLSEVRRLQEEQVQLQEQRRSAYGDGAIADLINALAENEARLDMITPELRDWLDEQGASQWLRVLV